MKVIDRYIARSIAFNYAAALVIMVTLYALLDMFVNMDEFTEARLPLPVVIRNILDYYWPNLFLYFRELSGVVTLFASMATILKMRRSNELTAMLASGMSLYRVALPILAFGMLTTGLLIVDTEWVIPALAGKLAREHDDVDGARARQVLFLPDRSGGLLSAGEYVVGSNQLRNLLLIRRSAQGDLIETIEADKATWSNDHKSLTETNSETPEPTDSSASGTWLLERGRRRHLATTSASILGPLESIEQDFPSSLPSILPPETIQIQQKESWIRLLSLSQLHALEKSGLVDPEHVARIRHARSTGPILVMVMLLLGLPFFLDRSPTDLLSDAWKCLLICGLCYAVNFIAQNVRIEWNSALPFWAPIFVFATLGMVMLDRIRT